MVCPEGRESASLYLCRDEDGMSLRYSDVGMSICSMMLL